MHPGRTVTSNLVWRSRRYIERLAGRVAAILARDDCSQSALEHFEMLVLLRVKVLWGKPPFTTVGGFHLQYVLGDPEQLQSETVVADEFLTLIRHVPTD